MVQAGERTGNAPLLPPFLAAATLQVPGGRDRCAPPPLSRHSLNKSPLGSVFPSGHERRLHMHRAPTHRRKIHCAGLALALAGALGSSPALAQDGKAVADVVVIVDTSTSMKDPGMDPERTSLLVAKLFSDIVPGDLAVVRMLDLEADKSLLPRRDTGQMQPCMENPSQQCHVVAPVTDWMVDARKGRFG